jgi:hypothetical protein
VRLRSVVARAAALALITATIATPSAAGTASISIDAVGGRKIANGEVKGTLSGQVLVQGAAIPAGAAPATPASRPLVADAGDSAYVGAGSPLTLLGAGFGGAEPYSFSWTASAGTLEGADSATAQVTTTGVAPGTYAATLTITDRAGATASDTVKFVLYQQVQSTLLDETRADGTPGALSVGVPGTINFPFAVPAGTTKFDVRVSWTSPVNDYDIRVNRPDGSEETSKGNNPGVPEEVTVMNPVAGTWTIAVDKFATATDNVRTQVTGLVPPTDPRPSVKSGGPYRFAVGTTQTISATVTGGTAPVTAGWDTDQDGRIDRTGTSFTGGFGQGRVLITARATDANGLEARETTSVLVATPDRLAADTTAISVIAINDTGVNAYHLEYSAATYPDPDVLRLTNNFQKHPSEYIAGYPKDTPAIRATLGKGYFPPEDAELWDLKSATRPNGLEFGKLYWIPGTKVIGAIQPSAFSCSNCAAGAHVILDDDGHGSGSTSVSAGNRYGYCPTCLLVISKGLSTAFSASAPLSWVDVNSNSWGAVANVPLDLVLADTGPTSRAAVERGQTVLFAAGNGNANAFESPSPTYGTATTGPDWNVVVGALRRDNQRAIIGEGTPAHLSSWGDGNLPSACRTGTVSQCAFGGTSAATPYTSGVFGTVLTAIRRNIGDGGVGQRPGQVIAEGFPVANSPYLADGKLTRAELRDAVLRTAFPLHQDNTQNISLFPFPWTAPYQGDINVLFEGYGAATPNSARRAIDVLMGRAAMPVREAEDRWFAIDRQIRDSIWGGYDRNGDGTRDDAAPLGSFGVSAASFATADLTFLAIKHITDGIAAALAQTNADANSLTYFLHRSSEGEPGVAGSCANGVTYMDQDDRDGDFDPCFENRATSVLAAYRPVGIWPSSTDSTVALPAGTTVDVELYLAIDQVSLVRPTGVLMAGDRELGSGPGEPTPTIGSGPWISQGFPVNPNIIVGAPALPTGVKIDQNKCVELGELCWNKLTWSFSTTRPAVPGEQITFQVQLIGARAIAYGYEGQHRSRIVITPAAMPGSGLDFSVAITEPTEGARLAEGAFTAYGSTTFPDLGTTEAGDHPAERRVDVSVDDPNFADPVQANLDEASGAWSAPIPRLAPGDHTLYARAQMGDNRSAVAVRKFTVLDTETSPRVQWQVTPRGGTPTEASWQPATGVLSYSFTFDSRTYGKGDFTIHTRLLEGGAPTATTSLNAKFSGN